MDEVYYQVHYQGKTFSTGVDPKLDDLLVAGARTLTITSPEGIEYTFSITQGVPIAVSKHTRDESSVIVY